MSRAAEYEARMAPAQEAAGPPARGGVGVAAYSFGPLDLSSAVRGHPKVAAGPLGSALECPV